MYIFDDPSHLITRSGFWNYLSEIIDLKKYSEGLDNMKITTFSIFDIHPWRVGGFVGLWFTHGGWIWAVCVCRGGGGGGWAY